MGIPKFFRHITNKNPNLILENLSINLNNLYLDMNCLIHPCVKRVESQNPIDVKTHNQTIRQKSYLDNINKLTEFERKSFTMIYEYILKLIDFSEPDKMLYLAIDGVAPRGKMEQQRVRRFRSVKEHEMRGKILAKYNNENEYFDSNCITPGTIFMKKLSNFLKHKLKEMSENESFKHLDLYLDDTGLRGEGEHKILQHIKKYTKDEINSIYGLDADLIMLSLVSGSKVYLLREAVHYGKVNMDELLFFDVDSFSDELFKEVKDKIDDNTYSPSNDDDESITDTSTFEEIEKQRIINDYVCLCFFIGNDFVPSIVGIDINTGGINSLLEIYCNIFSIRRKYLVDENNDINFIFVRQILTFLYSNEDNYLQSYQKRLDHIKPRMEYSNQMERELQELNFYPVFNKNNYLKLGYDNWQNLYYRYYFKIKNPLKNSTFIKNLCKNYIEGLQWNIKYYLDECVSYSWYYRYRQAPLLKDLVIYLIDRVYPTKFDDKKYTPLEQLSVVLPIGSSHLWATEYRKLVDKDLSLQINYPHEYQIDTLNNFYLHDCDPILGEFNDEYLFSVFKDLKLTDTEKSLNSDSDLYFITNNEIKLSIS